MLDPPFRVDRFGTSLIAAPEPWRDRFERDGAICIPGAIAPDHLADLVARSAEASFVDDHVKNIGSRAVEAPQRVGAAIALMLHNRQLMNWVAQATGADQIRAVAGRLVETRANGADALAWHDDCTDRTRLVAIVINLSDNRFTGGTFELRRKRTERAHFTFDHVDAGSMLLFAVNPALEHRVMPIVSGGPRRVFAGWFLSRPEHDKGSLASELATG